MNINVRVLCMVRACVGRYRSSTKVTQAVIMGVNDLRNWIEAMPMKRYCYGWLFARFVVAFQRAPVAVEDAQCQTERYRGIISQLGEPGVHLRKGRGTGQN